MTMSTTPIALATVVHPTPLGDLTLTASERGLRLVEWPPEPFGRVEPAGDRDPGPPAAVAVLERTTVQLDEYFAGTRTEFSIPLDPVGTEFQLQAWEALRLIPYGETSSYRQQAERVGRPSAVRAIGAANGRNPLSIVVPCHRVVGADGSLTGFGGGLEAKRFLLDLESRNPTLFR